MRGRDRPTDGKGEAVIRAYLFPALCGLLLGLAAQLGGYTRPEGLKSALGWRRGASIKTLLYALGLSMAMVALLCWLAVLDVDDIEVLPLSGGVLLGAALAGIAAGWLGYLPWTALGGVGGGRTLEALCVAAGCLLGAWGMELLPTVADGALALPPHSGATLFQMTLDEPYLLGGGFLSQGCVGLALMVAALCMPMPKAEDVPESAAAPTPPLALPPAPEEAREETFIALLPNEEPLIVDTTAEDQTEAGAEEAAEEAETVPPAVTEDTAPEEMAEASEAELPENTTSVSTEEEAPSATEAEGSLEKEPESADPAEAESTENSSIAKKAATSRPNARKSPRKKKKRT